MKYVGTYSDPKDIVTKDKLEAVASRVSTNEDNIAMAESDIEGLQTTVGTLQTNVNNVQTALTSKQDTVVGGASTITADNLTASRALISNSSGKVAVSTITSTELGYLDGVTSNVQTQLNNKVPTTRTVNNKALSSNIALTASDVSAIPNVPVTTTNNLDMLMVVNGNWQTDHDTAGIQNAASLIVNKWPDNVTIVLRSFRRWGKLCLFTVQINVTTQITSDYGFTLLEMPYASIDRVWINNQFQFYMDANKVAVRVNEEKLFTGNYALTGFYLTTDNARVVS